MPDVHSLEQRKKNMRAIKQKNTTPELKIRRLLFAKGFRFRIHVRSLDGSPDIVLPKYRVAIFVHGCFWHGHKCHLFKVPSTRTEFWTNKIDLNRCRDERDQKALIDKGWRVLTIWECALKGKKRQPDEVIVDNMTEWIRQRCTSELHIPFSSPHEDEHAPECLVE